VCRQRADLSMNKENEDECMNADETGED